MAVTQKGKTMNKENCDNQPVTKKKEEIYKRKHQIEKRIKLFTHRVNV